MFVPWQIGPPSSARQFLHLTTVRRCRRYAPTLLGTILPFHQFCRVNSRWTRREAYTFCTRGPGMTTFTPRRNSGVTLIEVLTALLMLSIIALISFRGLGSILDARDQAAAQTQKWRRLAIFFERFERDVSMAAPRPITAENQFYPAWYGISGSRSDSSLEFSRFASINGPDSPRRLGYRLNENKEIELWLWPGLDRASGAAARHVVLAGVATFELQYLNRDLTWLSVWPGTTGDRPIPRAVRVRLVLSSGEEIIRIFELGA
jgi:general secretion pathway protein J